MHIAMSALEPSAPLAYFASASGIYKHRRVHSVPRGDKLFQNIPLEVPKGFLFGYQTLESADCKGIYNRVPKQERVQGTGPTLESACLTVF